MKKQIINSIKKHHSELQANNGVVPDSWIPYIDFLKIFLHIAKLFTSDEIDLLIDELLAAIEIALLID